MQNKTIAYIVIAVIVVGGAIYLVAHKNSDNQQAMTTSGQEMANNTAPIPTAAAPAAQTTPAAAPANITPVTTTVSSVAGVDLSEFSNEANQSAAINSQDGSSDAQAISSDGTNINSSTDSVSNPIQ